MNLPPATFAPLTTYREYPEAEMRSRALAFRTELERRRTVRAFSERPVPRDLVEECLRAAGTAPSDANLQPWHFVVVSDPALKRQIRDAAEAEERRFYTTAPQDWLDALDAVVPVITKKPFEEIATFR